MTSVYCSWKQYWAEFICASNITRSVLRFQPSAFSSLICDPPAFICKFDHLGAKVATLLVTRIQSRFIISIQHLPRKIALFLTHQKGLSYFEIKKLWSVYIYSLCILDIMRNFYVAFLIVVVWWNINKFEASTPENLKDYSLTLL